MKNKILKTAIKNIAVFICTKNKSYDNMEQEDYKKKKMDII